VYHDLSEAQQDGITATQLLLMAIGHDCLTPIRQETTEARAHTRASRAKRRPTASGVLRL
jgi:hypothetical protein